MKSPTEAASGDKFWLAVVSALNTGTDVYGLIRLTIGFRLSEDDEFKGPDLAIHNIHTYPEEQVNSFGLDRHNRRSAFLRPRLQLLLQSRPFYCSHHRPRSNNVSVKIYCHSQ